MLNIIKEVCEIKKAQAKFEKAFKKFLNKKVDGFIGYKGERWKTALNWSDELGLWAVLNQIEGKPFVRASPFFFWLGSIRMVFSYLLLF